MYPPTLVAVPERWDQMQVHPDDLEHRHWQSNWTENEGNVVESCTRLDLQAQLQ